MPRDILCVLIKLPDWLGNRENRGFKYKKNPPAMGGFFRMFVKKDLSLPSHLQLPEERLCQLIFQLPLRLR